MMAAGDVTLPPQAELAMLKLQVRAAQRELSGAEAAIEQLTEFDATDSVAQLQARFQPMIDERRRANEVELEAARERARELIALAGANRPPVSMPGVGGGAFTAWKPPVPPPQVATSPANDEPDIVEWVERESELPVGTDPRQATEGDVEPDQDFLAYSEVALASDLLDVDEADDNVDEDDEDAWRKRLEDGVTDSAEGEPEIAFAQTPTHTELEHPDFVETMRVALRAELPSLIERLGTEAGLENAVELQRLTSVIAAELPDLVDRAVASFLAERTGSVELGTANVAGVGVSAVMEQPLRAVVDELASDVVERVARRVVREVGQLTEGSGQAAVALFPSTITMVVDAEPLATALALAFKERAVLAPPPPTVGYYGPQPPQKRSFWSNTWHADVLLSMIALIIVVTILIAWAV